MIAVTSNVCAMLKDFVRRFLYASGALPLYHRLRNAHSLTVVVFHRTLTESDPRWATSDPNYTLRRDLFAHSLAFFRRHYHPVSLQDVLDARRGQRRLPPRALLVTFDDGWADNADHALPELQRAGVPALLFVAADAVGRRQPFWQECIVGGWRRGALRVADLHPAPGDAAAGDNTLPALRAAIARLEAMPVAARDALLAPHAAALDDGLRHMVDADELRRLRAGGVALGLHGKGHVHMTRAADVDAELGGARAALAVALDEGDLRAESMSYPHGAFDPGIAQRARDAGYALQFTSVPVLNPTRGGIGWLLGRTGFEFDTVLDARSNGFRADRLAWYLFRSPVRTLA